MVRVSRRFPAMTDGKGNATRPPSQRGAFQASNWLLPTVELVLDRGMPGDGVINIPRLRAIAEAAA
jgi:hypothetical protein